MPEAVLIALAMIVSVSGRKGIVIGAGSVESLVMQSSISGTIGGCLFRKQLL